MLSVSWDGKAVPVSLGLRKILCWLWVVERLQGSLALPHTLFVRIRLYRPHSAGDFHPFGEVLVPVWLIFGFLGFFSSFFFNCIHDLEARSSLN